MVTACVQAERETYIAAKLLSKREGGLGVTMRLLLCDVEERHDFFT